MEAVKHRIVLMVYVGVEWLDSEIATKSNATKKRLEVNLFHGKI